MSDRPILLSLPRIPLEHKVALCISVWYVLSLITLWTNRYVVAELKMDSNLLSFAQLGMSVICGFASETYCVGWIVCKQGLQKVIQHGLKDMVLLGGVRILTVLFGLTALKYISVSFTQTIKSSAPFFTVVLTYFLLGQTTGWRVNLSLIPIVLGLIFCSLSDNSFHLIGFIAALLSNCVDCIQNVMTKKLLNKSYTVSQLQLYTSMIAVSMQIMFLAFNWFSNPRSAITGSSHHSALYLFVLLSFDGLGFYLQSIFAYLLMSMVSPVTHSVANCVKRALLITLSIFHYGNDVTLLNWTGMVLVIVGVYVFNAASRIERMESLKAILSGKNVSSCASVQIERKTISTLSEIRINR